MVIGEVRGGGAAGTVRVGAGCILRNDVGG